MWDGLHVGMGNLNVLGMGKNLIFPLCHCVLQCSRETCDRFIITGLDFPCCVCSAGERNPPYKSHLAAVVQV